MVKTVTFYLFGPCSSYKTLSLKRKNCKIEKVAHFYPVKYSFFELNAYFLTIIQLEHENRSSGGYYPFGEE